MEVKTGPSVSPNTPTHHPCHHGTLLNLTKTQLPICKRIITVLSHKIAVGQGGCACCVPSRAPGKLS